MTAAIYSRIASARLAAAFLALLLALPATYEMSKDNTDCLRTVVRQLDRNR
jgi:hypothetical protein